MRGFVWLLVGLLALASVAGASSGGNTQTQPRWVITDLGALGLRASFATAINERGQVIGYVDTKPKGSFGDAVTHAFLWQGGKMRDLGTLGGPQSRALAINDRGQVVGEADANAKDSEGFPVSYVFLWNGRMRVIRALRASSPAAITNRGEVVGQLGADAFLWRHGRRYLLWKGGANAANERGEIAGWRSTGGSASDGTPIWHAVLRKGGRLVDLGTLGGIWSEANAINERGQVVGRADTKAADTSSKYEDPIYNAFLWQGGRMRNLGSVARHSEAYAANDRGQIVGYVRPVGENQEPRPVVWQAGKTFMLPLPPGGHGGEARAINGHGTIVGWAYVKGIDHPHAVLWTLKRG